MGKGTREERENARRQKCIGKGGGGEYSGREVEMESRAKEAKEASIEKREGKKGDRLLPVCFFPSARRKDREIRNLVPFPIW